MLATKSHSQARPLRSYKTKLEIYANSLRMGQRTTAMVTTSNSSSKNTKNNKAKRTTGMTRTGNTRNITRKQPRATPQHVS